MAVKIIAELGINHNGDVSVLEEMILSAKACDVDYVKIQKRDVERCYTSEQLEAKCESPWGNTVRNKVAGRELDWDDIHHIDIFCRDNDVPWFASCWDLQSLADMKYYFPDMPLNKIPSAMVKFPKFVSAVAKQQKLTLISTALCESYDEIRVICQVFENVHCPYVVNHCVALYPCPVGRVNVNNVEQLCGFFESPCVWDYCKGVGYSGHEVGLLPTVIAVQLGATWVERHFTLDRSMYGADQAASLEPQGLARLVRDIRSLDVIGGSRLKVLSGDEKISVTWFDETDPRSRVA